jgi:catechol 2,3-dioxygenase-like lactoylglutathione lyase family enzyme
MTDNLGYDGGLTCALGCSDLDTAIRWYESILGFSLLYRMDEMAWAELKSPVHRVNLGLSQVEAVEPRGGATLTWGVRDISATRQTLEDQGVPFDGETMTIPGMVSLATFFDPDGNKHMLYEDLSSQDGAP